MDSLNEKFSNGKYCIGYIFENSDIEFFNRFLIVTFSAIPSDKSPIKHQYSFLKVLKDIPCRKLYIQDSCGEYGTYYLCNNMDFDVAKEVNELIESIRIENRIEKRNVILIGSSKGGTAALYHSLYGDYGHCISMGPQYYISQFLNSSNKVHQSILKDMVGENDIFESEKIIDQIISDAISKRKQTCIHILTSRNDSQFEKHIKPLLNQLDGNQMNNDILIDDRIQSHSDLATYNPKYTRNKLTSILLGFHNDYMLSMYGYEENKIIDYYQQVELNVMNKKIYDDLKKCLYRTICT